MKRTSKAIVAAAISIGIVLTGIAAPAMAAQANLGNKNCGSQTVRTGSTTSNGNTTHYETGFATTCSYTWPASLGPEAHLRSWGYNQVFNARVVVAGYGIIYNTSIDCV